VHGRRRIFRAAPESTAVVAPLTGPPLYIIIPVVPIPHPIPRPRHPCSPSTRVHNLLFKADREKKTGARLLSL